VSVVDFDGRTHPWPPPGYEVNLDDIRPRSSLHIRCRELLRQMYPTQPVLEEVPIPGERLFCDFYLPMRKVVIECHGQQHDVFTPHFHKTKAEFRVSQNRDRRKIEWCHMNNIRVAVLPYDETDEQWQTKIENADD